MQHKNLGILTTLRIGHDNAGPSAKWLVEHVVVRNEVSGHTYKFPCGRWLGRGIDDSSTERLLVGQLVPRTVDSEELVEACRTPPRARSPSLHRPELRPSDIQHQLGNCVNAIVKWHYRPSRDRDTGSLTTLLCGEDGLAKGMENAFQCGFKSQRLFGRNLYVWDYFGGFTVDGTGSEYFVTDSSVQSKSRSTLSCVSPKMEPTMAAGRPAARRTRRRPATPVRSHRRATQTTTSSSIRPCGWSWQRFGVAMCT